MTDADLYQQLYTRVREMESILKKHRKGASVRAPRTLNPRNKPSGANARLLEQCAQAFNISAEKIISDSRAQNAAVARHLYSYIRYHHSSVLPQTLGKELGRHRTTVLHSLKQAADLLKVDKSFRKKYNEIINNQIP
jgi:chromosomal replication initiation ATPase DnaA